MKDTAVVILNWNGAALLKKFLPSVIAYSPEASIYVADNASTDDSIHVLKTNFPEVKIIQNTINGGFAKGYNDALINLTEDYFILLNSDVEVTQNWLIPIIKIFNEDINVAAVQPKILDYKNKSFFEYAGAAGGFIDKFGYPYCRGRIFEHLEEDTGQYNDEIEIFWASGACMAVRKNYFNQVGGFDEDYFAHQEEIDLCWRFHHYKFKVKYTGDSHVFHVGGATLDTMSSQKTFLNFRNSLFNLTKNLPSGQLFLVLISRMILDGIAGLKFLIWGKFNHFLAILRAHYDFYTKLSIMLKKRKKVPQKLGYYSKFSVVCSHFLKGKKYFSDL